MPELMRTRWAAVGAAVAVTLGAGGLSLTQAAISSGDKPVYVALSEPCRLVDTRPSSGPIGPKGTPINAGEANAYEIQVTGDNGNCTGGLALPADAVAVALNVTAIQPTSPTGRSFFTVYPGDASLPDTSNLNFVTGQPPTPNKVDVGLSGTGTIKISNAFGTAHAAVDVFGYYIDHNHDDRYYTKATTRAIATPEITRLTYTSQGSTTASSATMTKLQDIGEFTTSGGTVRITMTSSGNIRDGDDPDTTSDGLCTYGLRVDGAASSADVSGGFTGAEVHIGESAAPLVLIDVFEGLAAGTHDLDLYYRNPFDGCRDNVGVFPQMVLIEEYPD